MVRGVKKLVNTSEVLCINGMDASNSAENSSTTPLNSLEMFGKGGEWATFAEQDGSAK